MDIFLNPTYSWLPPLILVVVLLLGLSFGIWNGWKSALYFLIWNFLGAMASIIVIVYFFDSLTHYASNVKFGDNGLTLKDLIDQNKEQVQSVLGVVFSFLVILVANILAFLTYWIFRRWLKGSIKRNKEAGKSNKGARFAGSVVGLVTTVPVAVFATSLATTLSPTNSFTNLSSKLSFGISGGSYKDFDTDFKDIVNTVYAVSEASADLESLGKIFDPNTDWENDKEAATAIIRSRDHINTILNSKMAINSLPVLAKSFGVEGKKFDFHQPPADAFKLSELTDEQGNSFEPFVVSGDQRARLIDEIAKTYGTDDTTPADVENYLLSIHAIAA